MFGNILFRVDPVLIAVGMMCLLIGMSELGYGAIFRRLNGAATRIEKEDIALVLGAVLTLLALLLGFTYSMSASRFDTRRHLVVEEANAIGTSYLRAQTLPEPWSSETQKLLRQYTSLRVELARTIYTHDITPELLRTVKLRSESLHDLLWAQAAALARESPTPITSLFIQALNEMIDLNAKRLAALYNRVPLPIYLVLFLVSSVALFLLGFYLGSSNRRMRVLTVTLAILVASVLWLIMDLDQPFSGTIMASQETLFDLQRELSQPFPVPKK